MPKCFVSPVRRWLHLPATAALSIGLSFSTRPSGAKDRVASATNRTRAAHFSKPPIKFGEKPAKFLRASWRANSEGTNSPSPARTSRRSPVSHFGFDAEKRMFASRKTLTDRPFWSPCATPPQTVPVQHPKPRIPQSAWKCNFPPAQVALAAAKFPRDALPPQKNLRFLHSQISASLA